MMNDHRKSDSSVVSTKLPNNISDGGKEVYDESYTGTQAETLDTDKDKYKDLNCFHRQIAEAMERRELAKENLNRQNTRRMQCRERVHSELERVRQLAKADKKVKFTSLMHHIYSLNTLEAVFFGLKRDAAAGVDGIVWETYEKDWEENLKNLSERLKHGAYRAKAVKRVFIPKQDGKQRPIGVTALEDKIVQRATVEVMNAIYETDFLGFSYGYRPGRSQHNCLDALYVGILTKKVNHVIDADISGFFDGIDHRMLIEFISHRIADKRVLHLIQKWLNAGVLEDGRWRESEIGTPQGGCVSPLISNIYLHYVLDLWIQKWSQKFAQGEMIIVRWADDFVIGCQKKTDAVRIEKELHERFEKFKLQLHPQKTRLIEFGPFAIENQARKNRAKPETFNFLGFTHICGKRRNGMFTVIRKTVRKKMSTKLKEVKIELRRRMHDPIPKVGAWLRSVIRGFNRYYGVPTNESSLHTFRYQIGTYWHLMLRRRSQKSHVTWERTKRLIDKWLPYADICHPFPLKRWGGKI
jgi:RNA-directed DNA polymerase